MDDKSWFKEHIDTIIRDHAGKFVSVLNGEIIAIGDDMDQIRRKVMQLKRSGAIHGIPYTGRAAQDFAVIHLPPCAR